MSKRRDRLFDPFTAIGSVEKGAPVEWLPLDLVPTNVGGAAIAAQPPHPHAALLLADYLLGPEGQALLANYQYAAPPRISVSNAGDRTMESAPTSTRRTWNVGRNCSKKSAAGDAAT